MVGFLLGGVLTSALGWRSIFFINGPIGAAAVVVALVFLPHDASAGRRQSLDLPGAVAITLGSGLVILGVGQAESAGWTSARSLAPIFVGAGLTALFVVIEGRANDPLLPARVLRRRNALSIIGLTVLAVVSNAVIYLSRAVPATRARVRPRARPGRRCSDFRWGSGSASTSDPASSIASASVIKR